MLGPLWSIATEEQFYIMFPFFIFLILNLKNIKSKILLIIYVIVFTLSVKLLLPSQYSLFAYLNLVTRLEHAGYTFSNNTISIPFSI